MIAFIKVYDYETGDPCLINVKMIESVVPMVGGSVIHITDHYYIVHDSVEQIQMKIWKAQSWKGDN